MIKATWQGNFNGVPSVGLLWLMGNSYTAGITLKWHHNFLCVVSFPCTLDLSWTARKGGVGGKSPSCIAFIKTDFVLGSQQFG